MAEFDTAQLCSHSFSSIVLLEASLLSPPLSMAGTLGHTVPNAQATRPQRCASKAGTCLAVQRPVRAVTWSRPMAFRAQRQWTVLRSATEEQGVCSLWLVSFLVGHRGWFTTSWALLKPPQ